LIVAVASGKGGTGKTTVAVNLAKTVSKTGMKVSYIDCDVEEPNGHIFLKPVIETNENATTAYPSIDEDKCTSCGKCAEICQFKSIIFLENKPLIFKDMCHSCGGCVLVCPENAICESQRKIGIVEKGISGNVLFVHGKSEIGQAMSPPLIRIVKENIPECDVTILDCPPGTSCPVIESVKGSDYVILVTEPTPFGLNDLQLAVEVISNLKIPFGVFINRENMGDQNTVNYCHKKNIPVVGVLPDDRKIAEIYSSGDLFTVEIDKYGKIFIGLLDKINEKVKGKRI